MTDHLRMGLRRLGGADWLELDHPLTAPQVEAKVRLMQTQADELLVIETGSAQDAIDAACTELAEEVAAEFVRQGRRAPHFEPGLHRLDAVARTVREDLCLHLERDGRPHLVAGSVCFPTRWTLAEKVGRPIDVVHAPVPGYSDALAAKVQQFMRRIAPGPGVWRRNWSIVPTGAWSLPGHHDGFPPMSEDPDELFYRTERQTLRRLPRSGAVIFTIAVDVTAFPALESPLAHALADEIDRLPDAFARYKGLHHRTDVVPYLRSR